MVSFRRWTLAIAVLALFAGMASAQVGTPTGGPTGTPFACTANVAVPPQLRQEGLTEAVGDIVLTCTGGNPLALGATIPFANMTITLGTQVTSRLLNTTQVPNVSEALLLIDEPGNPGLTGVGPSLPQLLCTNSLSGCPAVVGPGLTMLTPTGTQAPNMYQGLLSPNSFQVTFNGIPVLPPVSAGVSRVFRITNIRGNASGVPSGLGGVGQLQASIAISGSTSVPVTNPVVTVGFVQSSLTTSLRNNRNDGAGGSTAFNQCSSATLGFVDILRYSEQLNFATAFKTRVAPTGSYNGQSSNAIQNVPGNIYNSESDFIQPSVSGGGFTAGLADFGTRLRAVFSNIPSGMRIFVSTTNVSNIFVANATQPPATSTTPFAQLVISESAPDGNGTVPSAPQTGTLTSCGSCGSIGYAEIPLVAGAGTAVWEVVNTNPAQPEVLDFGVWTTYTGNQTNNSPPAGTGSVQMSYAPVVATGGATASGSLPIPRFVDQSSPQAILNIRLCQTVLLFPYITNASGLDTGMALSNTSKDPFGYASNQNGTCTMSFFGNATIAPFTTPVILSGDANTNTTDWAFTLSSVPGANPGFQGYAIAVCNFQFAHGFAFISDVGTRNLAMGYLALTLDTGTFNRSNNLPTVESTHH